MKKLMIGLAATVVAAPAMAAAPWTYVQLAYLEADSDLYEVDTRTTGYGIEGSLGFLENWHVQGAYGKLKGEENDGSPRFDRQKVYSIRIGYHGDVTESLQIVADLGYSKAKLDGDATNADSGAETTFYDLRVGPRYFAGEKLELGAYIIAGRGKGMNDDDAYYDKFKYSDMSFRADIQYHFTPAWSIGARFNLKDGDAGQAFEGDSVGVNIRWSFADRW